MLPYEIVFIKFALTVTHIQYRKYFDIMNQNSNENNDKELYSFNPDNLKQRFFELANNAFISHNIYTKQYNLLMFRTLFPQLPLPELFFTYSTDLSYNYDTLPPITDLIKSYLEDQQSEKHGSYSISNILQNCFRFKIPITSCQASPKTQLFKPEPTFFETPVNTDNDIDNQIDPLNSPPEISISFINDFFCISSFPALFGHFSSEEYIRAGYNFIKIRINDPLSPNLVAVYLLHCSQFKDRFLQSFVDTMIYNFQQVTMDDHFEENLDKMCSIDNLLESLYISFKETIFYLTEYHFNIVNLLREKDEEAALLAVCYYFLREVVSLFKYSPLLSESGLLSKSRCPKNPLTYARIMRIDYLDTLTDQLCINRSFGIKILDLFREMSFGFTEMPKISTMKYEDGFNFCFSLADIHVLNCIYYAEKYPNKSLEEYPSFSNIKDFILEMFTIKENFRQYIKTGINEPERTEISSEMTDKKLEEQKEFHLFLTDRSDGMKHLEMCSDCALNNLRLKEKQYITNLWKCNNRIDYTFSLNGQIANCYSLGSSPIDYETEMLTSLCYSIFNGQLHFEQDYQKIISNQKLNLQELYSRIRARIFEDKSEKTFCNRVYETATYFLNEICNFSSNGKSFTNELVESTKYACDAIERTSFELLLTAFNSIPCRFIKSELPETPAGELIDTQINFDEFRSINLAQFLSFNNEKPPEILSEVSSLDDEEITVEQISLLGSNLADASQFLKSIIFVCNHSMQNEYQLVIEKFRAGDKLALFLIIEDMIEKSLERCDFGYLGPDYLKYYYTYVIKDEFKYFLANLINCIYIFTKHFTEKSYLYPSISQQIVEKLNYLKVVFNISPTISKLVY